MARQNSIRKMIDLARARSTDLPQRKRLGELLEEAASVTIRSTLGIDAEVHCQSCRLLDQQSLIGSLPEDGVHLVSAEGERIFSFPRTDALQLVEAVISSGASFTAKSREPTRTDAVLVSGIARSIAQGFEDRAHREGITPKPVQTEYPEF